MKICRTQNGGCGNPSPNAPTGGRGGIGGGGNPAGGLGKAPKNNEMKF